MRRAAEGLAVAAGGIVGKVSLGEAELVRGIAVLQLRRDDLVHKVLQGATFDTFSLSFFNMVKTVQWSAVRVTPSGNPRDLNFSRTVVGITKWFWVTIEGYLSYLLPKFEDLVPTSLGSGPI